MPVAGLHGITRAKDPRTTIPGTGPDHRPDLVDREFTARGTRGNAWGETPPGSS
jgi:putative transposase